VPRRAAPAAAFDRYEFAAGAFDGYHNGVPLTETQLWEVFAAYQSELAELPPPAVRTEWDMKRQFAAAQRLAVLTGTHPHAFPNVGNADQAWEWYAANNPYATAGLPPCRRLRNLTTRHSSAYLTPIADDF
jgi:hypothetical protein